MAGAVRPPSVRCWEENSIDGLLRNSTGGTPRVRAFWTAPRA